MGFFSYKTNLRRKRRKQKKWVIFAGIQREIDFEGNFSGEVLLESSASSASARSLLEGPPERVPAPSWGLNVCLCLCLHAMSMSIQLRVRLASMRFASSHCICVGLQWAFQAQVKRSEVIPPLCPDPLSAAMKLAALLIAAVLQNTAGMKLGSLESKSVQLGDKRNQSALLGKTAVQLEPEAFALFGAKNTPELAELKKQMANSIKNEMKPALMANLQKVQAQVDAAAKAGNQCGSKALEEASEYNSKFSSAKDAHATCRGEESTLIRENKTCSTELTELTTAKETQCNAVTALEQSQSRASEACATASGESYLAQMERLRSHFDQAVTEYKNQKDLCSTATAKVGKKLGQEWLGPDILCGLMGVVAECCRAEEGDRMPGHRNEPH